MEESSSSNNDGPAAAGKSSIITNDLFYEELRKTLNELGLPNEAGDGDKLYEELEHNEYSD